MLKSASIAHPLLIEGVIGFFIAPSGFFCYLGRAYYSYIPSIPPLTNQE
jgi:hypothetical protein